MRTLCLLILLFMTLHLAGQITIDYGKQWNVRNQKGFGPNYCTIIFQFQNDTIINGMEYLQLFSKLDTVATEEWTATNDFLREDNLNKVYIIRNDGEEELLYDYNLNVGDTVVHTPYNQTCEMIVTEIDSIELLNGAFRKRLKLVNPSTTVAVDPQYWVQGIGSTTGSLTAFTGSCNLDFELSMSCFSENEALLFINPWTIYCFDTNVSVGDIQIENPINIYPNPASSELFIEATSTISNIILYAIDGRNLGYLKLEGNTVDISKYQKGIYFMEIVFDEGSVVEKLVIQD